LVTVPDTSINNCNGTGPNNIGVLNSSVNGGTSPYGYLWNTTDTTSTISGLIAGTYTLTVTDVNGCTGSDPGTVAYTSLSPSFTLPQIRNIFCHDGNNGSISVGLNNLAVPPITYQWSTSPNDTTNTVTNLVAGTYSVTGTDAVGCSATASYTLINPPLLTNTDTVTNSYCGLPNGAISITPSGGTPTYTFVWSTGATTEDITSLVGDSTYYVTITDAVGCTLVDTINVGNDSPFTLSGVVTNILCNGASTGAIDLTVTGSAIYTFVWNNTAVTEDISGVVAGTYTVTVTDDDGCRDTYTGIITQPQPVVVTITPQIAPCSPASGGTLTANGTGGTGTITYAWTPTANTATVTNLVNGLYTVTATDANGCTGTASYTVDQPAQTLAVSISGTLNLCSGGNTGTLTATATGGDPNYNYSWTPQGSTATISGLGAGVYTVTVTDARQCSATASATINNLPAVIVNSSVQLFACANPTYGDVTITATGGTGAGYTYNVTGVGNNTTGLFGNVPAGTYNYSVTDTAGCSAQNSFTITVPPADVYTVTTDSTSCYGSAFFDGSITVTPSSNQNGPFTYSLNFGATQPDSQFLNVASGTYTVVVTNNNGCSDTLQAAVSSPAQLFVSATPDTIVTAPGISNGIQVTVTNYNNPSIEWTPTDGLSCTDCLNPSAAVNQNTVFYITVTDNGLTGCAATDSVVIIVNGRVEMPDAFSPNGDGKNDRFGPVSFGIITVKSFRIYNRWGQLIHDKNEPWDGKYNGKEQPTDNYVYYISIETADENNPGAMKVINKSNSFTLLR
jgi:gliding motility-associated-like protein